MVASMPSSTRQDGGSLPQASLGFETAVFNTGNARLDTLLNTFCAMVQRELASVQEQIAENSANLNTTGGLFKEISEEFQKVRTEFTMVRQETQTANQTVQKHVRALAEITEPLVW